VHLRFSESVAAQPQASARWTKAADDTAIPEWEFVDQNQVINVALGTMSTPGSSSLVSPLRHTLLRPITSPMTSGPPRSHLGCDRSVVILLLYK
jgi:hypothetical protein